MYSLIPNVRLLESHLAKFAEILDADEVSACGRVGNGASDASLRVPSPCALLKYAARLD